MARRAAAALALLPALRAMLAGSSRRMALGAALAALTVLTGMGLLGLSGWFIAATAIAGLQVASALVFDVFAPSAGIRLLALGRTATRYGGSSRTMPRSPRWHICASACSGVGRARGTSGISCADRPGRCSA